MANKSKFFLFVIVALLTLLMAKVAWHYISLRAENNILADFDRFFEAGDSLKARDKAHELAFFDSTIESFYLANLDISESLENRSNNNKLILAAAANLDKKSGFNNKFFKTDFFLLKASISSMVGNKFAAIKYASEACNLSSDKYLKELELCLSSYYSGPSLAHDPNYSKWDALRLYEWSVLYNFVGKGDKTRSRFYVIIALRYFDIKMAHILRQDMVNEGAFTSDMGKYYCRATTPVKDVLCAEADKRQNQRGR